MNQMETSYAVKCLEKFAKEKGYDDVDTTTGNDPTAEKNNFLGVVYKAAISVKNKSSSLKTIRLYIKEASTIEHERLMLPFNRMFTREIYAYTELFPELNKLQDNIDAKEILVLPGCYLQSNEECREFLALEDLSFHAYKMHYQKIEPLNYDYMIVATNEIAKLHSLSFALMVKNPSKFFEIARNVSEHIFFRECDEHDPVKIFAGLIANRAVEILQDDENVYHLKKYATNLYDNMTKLLKSGKNSTFIHGDYWKNNILFKYENGLPVTAALIDFQLLNYSSPVIDILYLIFLNTTYEFRRAHYNDLLDHYHQQLTYYLKKQSVDVDTVYSKKEFMDEIKQYGSYALTAGIFFLPFVTSQGNEIGNTSEAVQGVILQNTDSLGYKLYKERLSGILKSVVEYGYL